MINPELNHENIKKLRDFIEALPDNKFNMNWWMFNNKGIQSPRPVHLSMTNEDIIHSCDTVGCIGGWAQALFGDPTRPYSSSMVANTGEYLGLDDEESITLFYPTINKRYKDLTKKEAVDILDRLDEVGYVDWAHLGLARGKENYER